MNHVTTFTETLILYTRGQEVSMRSKVIFVGREVYEQAEEKEGGATWLTM